MCGEARCSTQPSSKPYGLPPRVRGSQVNANLVFKPAGSTPAYAGKPRLGSQCLLCPGVYPAYAGKPSSPLGDYPPRRVYPRVCGEAYVYVNLIGPQPGLPPRMRGSHGIRKSDTPTDRPTPACAGKPAPALSPIRSAQVYPRVCGEAVSFLGVSAGNLGLPPRMRGSRADANSRPAYARSTPAYAGKPAHCPASVASDTVYPRVCGEAVDMSFAATAGTGLPPRMRGSLIQH